MPPQVPALTGEQIARFKRDGFVVLPGVLDQDLCAQVRDDMWATIESGLPRMKRHDPATWGPITEEEHEQLAVRPEGGGDPYFSGKGHRFTIRNGAEDKLLDLAVRPLYTIAEQLLGEGTVEAANGLDDDDMTVGPAFMSDDVVNGLGSHIGDIGDWPEKGTFATEPALRLPKTGPVWITGQGTRGLYCTLPNSPDPGPDYRGAHSDGACYGRWRVQISAYTDDLPPKAGGFTVWPGSHTRVWEEQWQAFFDGEKHTDAHLAERRAGGYTDPAIVQTKADTEPVETYGPAGTVVLWHNKILHMAGQNQSTDVIRQATIYAFAKTVASVPDNRMTDESNRDIWRDWSDEVRSA